MFLFPGSHRATLGSCTVWSWPCLRSSPWCSIPASPWWRGSWMETLYTWAHGPCQKQEPSGGRSARSFNVFLLSSFRWTSAWRCSVWWPSSIPSPFTCTVGEQPRREPLLNCLVSSAVCFLSAAAAAAACVAGSRCCLVPQRLKNAFRNAAERSLECFQSHLPLLCCV